MEDAEQSEGSRGFPWAGIFAALVIGVFPLVAAICLVVWPIGPVRWFIELQDKWFGGSYYPKATFAIVWIVLVVIVMSIGAGAGALSDRLRGR